MATRDEIIEKIAVMQRAKAKLQAYRDVIAWIEKYERTLMRKHSDAAKKKDKLGKVDKKGNAYYAALNETVQLQYQIKEAKQLRLTLSEVALQIAEDSEQAEKGFTDMVDEDMKEAR